MDSVIDIGVDTFAPFGSETKLVDGFLVVSAHRAFAHDESAYDGQYDHEAPDAEPGRRLVSILTELGVNPGGACLEIGCGTGLLSVGLVDSNFFRNLVVSDGSVSFLKIAQRKLAGLPGGDAVTLALLQADDMENLSNGVFDVIAMRSVLHHVNYFGPFLDLLISKLKPGGVLCCLEPRAESFMWMGTVMAMVPVLAGGAGIDLNEHDCSQIQLFVDTMAYYLRRDIDKADGEDKYAFWIDELLEAGRRNQAHVSFYPEDLEVEDAVDLMLDYLKYCMGFSEELLAKTASCVEPLRANIAKFTAGARAPDLSGWFFFRRIADNTTIEPSS